MPRLVKPIAKPSTSTSFQTGPQIAVLDSPALSPANPIESELPTNPSVVVERRIEFVAVQIPQGEIRNGHLPQHVDAWLKPHQAAAMQRLLVGLRDRRETTADRREVRTPADAVRWLLERVGGAHPA